MLKRSQSRISSYALAVLSGVCFAQSAMAQEHNHPVLNSFGRFWGIGWSQGYHSPSADGRFQFVKNNHPANMYASSALTYPYQPGYESIPGQYGSMVRTEQAWPQTMLMAPQGASHGAPVSPAMVPPPKPKPIEPPPAWLKPYLKDDQPSDKPAIPSIPRDAEKSGNPEASPSDLPAIENKETADDDLLLPQTNLTPLQRYYQAKQRQMQHQ